MTMMDTPIKSWEVKFEKRYYQRKFGGKLFDWKELERIINIRPLMTSARVHQSKVLKWKNSFWAIDKNCYPPSILKSVIENEVVYIQDASRFTSRLNDFAKHLEEDYRKPFDAHIYVCKNIDAFHPFGIHFDKAHNVIVQCEGQTNWKVWDKINNPEELLKSQMNVRIGEWALDDDPILDVDMKPGDVIWIPKHYPHLATSKNHILSFSFPQHAYVEDEYIFEEREWIKL